ncbi:MAG: hypothetical protein D6732_26075 [Methanobacteriota archaeon]|nr:MAG: hypothetical protein D6732_26075 [Euryarchaeota archaeon]
MHFYTRDGKPCHFQEIKTGKNKGQLRPTTMRDAKKLDLVPSVTEIIGVMDKGQGLLNWLIAEAVKEATEPDYVRRDYAAEGAAIHKFVEDWINGDDVADEGMPYVSAMKNAFDFLGVKDPKSEVTFAFKGAYPFGGTVDIVGDGIICDIKTKSLASKQNHKSDEYAMQLYAYSVGLGMEGCRLANIFLCRENPGEWGVHEYTKDEIERAKRMWELCLKLFYIKHNLVG